jgi:hypothetical protein
VATLIVGPEESLVAQDEVLIDSTWFGPETRWTIQGEAVPIRYGGRVRGQRLSVRRIEGV